MRRYLIAGCILLGIAIAAFPQTVVVGPWAAITSTVNLLAGSTIGTYNGIATVGNGVPSLVAKFDATAQGANIATATLYAVPAAQGGLYRFSCYTVVTQAATTSSTLPQCAAFWTDLDSSTAVSVGVSTAAVGNTVGTNSAGQSPSSQTAQPWFYAKGGTNIQYATNSYASVGGTAMQYAVHIKLEYLGN